MKTEKTPAEEKAEIIKLFAEAINKNTTTAHQVWSIIHVLQDAGEFMEDKRYQFRTEKITPEEYLAEEERNLKIYLGNARLKKKSTLKGA